MTKKSVVDATIVEREQVEAEFVWQNECRLVLGGCEDGKYKTGEMGVCHPDGSEVQVTISSWDERARHVHFHQLEGVPVRITIERVPGGMD
jgi:hypothetical protein